MLVKQEMKDLFALNDYMIECCLEKQKEEGKISYSSWYCIGKVRKWLKDSGIVILFFRFSQFLMDLVKAIFLLDYAI